MLPSDSEKNLVMGGICDRVVLYDRELRVRWANRAAIESAGAPSGGLIGRNCREIWSAWNLPFENSTLTATMESGEVQCREYEIPGEQILRVADSPVKDNLGNLLGAVETVAQIPAHREADADWLQREQRFRAFVQTTNEWIWSIDIRGKHTYCNPALESILGYSPQEFVGGDGLECLHPDDRRRVEEMLAEKRVRKEGWSRLILRWRHKDGAFRYLESSAVPILDQSGRLLGFQGADRDITSQMRAEEALRESEARFRSLVEATSDWIWEVDADEKYTYASPKLKDLLGYEPSEVIGKTPYELMLPEEASRVASLLTPLIAMARPFVGIENLNRHKEGHTVLLETSGVPILDAEGRLLGYRGIDRDITERKRAEQTLRESEERYRLLYETMAQGVVYQSADGRIISANRAAEKLLGVTLDQLRGRTSHDPRWRSIREDGTDYPGDQHPAMIALRTGQPVSDAVMGIFHPLELRHRWIVVNAIPQFRAGETRPFQVYTTLSDITERKLAEESLKYLSVHDVLTGLFNRQFFEGEISRLDRGRRFPISIIMADVDGLKATNDRSGHSAGDELLKRTGLILKETFRAEEVVARMGGDEFAVLLPSTGPDVAKARLNRLRNNLLAHNAAHSGPPLSFSMGVATADTAGSLDDALRLADARMYKEKQTRNKTR